MKGDRRQLELFGRHRRRSTAADERKLMARLRRVENDHFAVPFAGVLGPSPSRAAIKRLMTKLPRVTAFD